MLCIYGRKIIEPLWEWLRESCSCDLCGKLLDITKYLLYIVIGSILLILIVLVAVVAFAMATSTSLLILPLLLPIYLFKWLIDKLRRKETDPGSGGSIVQEPEPVKVKPSFLPDITPKP